MRFIEMAVAVDQHHGFKPFVRPPRCRLQSYSHFEAYMIDFTNSNLSLSFKQSVEAIANIPRSFSTPCLSLATKVDEDLDRCNPRIEIIHGHQSPMGRALVAEVTIAMACGANPVPASGGLGGAYFFHGRNGEAIAVAKPVDEEPLAVNNPKGFAGQMLGQPGMKRSIRVGETGYRELAAYILDHGGFAGVPPTVLVKISNVNFHVNDNSEPISAKIASLQRYVDHDSDAGDLGPSGFSVASVHRIGILDVRILNLDRHCGNILLKKGPESYAVGSAELVPIDHGLCLPESLDDPYFEWLHWPQASIPFSDFEIEYISNLDPFRDAELLRAELPSLRESAIRVLVLCTIFLKQATAVGLCLADIGDMMTREFSGGEENLSVLENLCVTAKNSMSSSRLSDNCTNVGQGEEQIEIFQFDCDCEENLSNQDFDLPHLLEGQIVTDKSPNGHKISSTGELSELLDTEVSSLLEADDNNKWDYDTIAMNSDSANNEDGCDDDHKASSVFTKSMSFSVQIWNLEGGGISFGEMSEEEWEMFLESFEKLLPEAFEGAKSMGLLKQRLGTSCKF